jgi:hypothetical protein
VSYAGMNGFIYQDTRGHEHIQKDYPLPNKKNKDYVLMFVLGFSTAFLQLQSTIFR